MAYMRYSLRIGVVLQTTNIPTWKQNPQKAYILVKGGEPQLLFEPFKCIHHPTRIVRLDVAAELKA
jgi:hypothetical protein